MCVHVFHQAFGPNLRGTITHGLWVRAASSDDEESEDDETDDESDEDSCEDGSSGDSGCGSSDVDCGSSDDGSCCSRCGGHCNGDGSSSYSSGSGSDDGSDAESDVDWWGLIPDRACLEAVTAAAEVLGAVLVFHPCSHEQPQQLVQLPVLLLCAAVAALRVFGAEQSLRLVGAAVAVVRQVYCLRLQPTPAGSSGPESLPRYRCAGLGPLVSMLHAFGVQSVDSTDFGSGMC